MRPDPSNLNSPSKIEYTDGLGKRTAIKPADHVGATTTRIGCFTMWRTSAGERVLHGHEWNLFREGLWTLWDRIELTFADPDSWPAGVSVFDRLEAGSKLAMLAMVGKALHDPDEPSPPLNALTEGTFGAVYAVIREEIELEIDTHREASAPEAEQHQMRTLVLAATRETNPYWDHPELDPDWEGDEDDTPSLPQPDSEDEQTWDDLIEELMDRVLWGDRDFEDEDIYVDSSPRLQQGIESVDGNRPRVLRRHRSRAERPTTRVNPRDPAHALRGPGTRQRGLISDRVASRRFVAVLDVGYDLAIAGTRSNQ